MKNLHTLAGGPKMRRPSSGMTGVYYVAAELSGRNYTALVTTRNTKAVDIIATNNATFRSVGIQVKTTSPTSPRDHWLMNKADRAPTSPIKNLVYVFVNLNKSGLPSYFVVPGKEVKNKIRENKSKDTGRMWYAIYKKEPSGIGQYEGRWDVIDSMTNPV